jgi:nucleoside-diphosphate-sugar epimerase
VQVCAGAQHRARHRVPRRHRGQGAGGQKDPRQRPRLPLLAIRYVIIKQQHSISVVVGRQCWQRIDRRRRALHNAGDVAAFFALKRIEVGTGGCVPLVHVDDVCRAEVFVAEEAAAGRYICCSINTTVIDIARFLPDQYPQYTVRTDLM